MSYAQHIIQKFGGVRATATAISRAPSTVQGWKDRGSIPDDQKLVVLEAAEALGLAVTRDDFWPSASIEGAAQ
ncbi:carph-isopro domain-containing protein [Paracoccus shanxieyensis]|uniref:Helix-turn-helix domain-containing protein n=1 Tax=Paracoccus shanxieyensis TaxID=2675752 RepID=A0A6L6J7U9_9RHOB|nr:hypothetical protein [Paracoccus shanxieyensis]MTH66724.1 hypothetical protein [Paracoccus shanxieyensis]MTH89959.1 hypothetical protein [Paracoccus shanxieyensis]